MNIAVQSNNLSCYCMNTSNSFSFIGLVQEGAGKGLALVYEATKDNRAKQEVLKAVVEQLTVGRKSAIKVSDETTLFQEGELGESPTGSVLWFNHGGGI